MYMKMRKKHGEEGMEEEENIDSVLKWMWLFTIRPFLLISRLIELTGHSLLIVSIALDTKGTEEKGQQARSESRVISRNDRVSVFIVYGVGSRLSTGEKSPPKELFRRTAYSIRSHIQWIPCLPQ